MTFELPAFIACIAVSVFLSWAHRGLQAWRDRRAWLRSEPDPVAVAFMVEHISAQVEWDTSRPAVSADPVFDHDKEKRVSWARSR
jgi:hypothetical protein